MYGKSESGKSAPAMLPDAGSDITTLCRALVRPATATAEPELELELKLRASGGGGGSASSLPDDGATVGAKRGLRARVRAG